MLMWSHYSDGHKGFCIEYDFKNNSDVTYYMEPVFYSDKVFDITPYLGINSKRFAIKIAAITKAEDWKYEQEWRLTFPLSIRDLEKGLYRINAPKAIYLGTRFEENPIDKKNKFLKVAEHLNIQVLQMVAHKSEFKIIPA
ncbi:MAG: hypothetical protein C0525_12950 [Flavobacterium sp.]|nr:hypothetical protein [Flavobacterium sp.]